MPLPPPGTFSDPALTEGEFKTALESQLAVLAEIIPAGLICAFGGATAPSGWLLCDGATVSRTAYAALFAALSTTYGAGDGSTTFGLPNLKGRMTVGRDAGQAEFNTLGETGGALTHTHNFSTTPSGDPVWQANGTYVGDASGLLANFQGGGTTYMTHIRPATASAAALAPYVTVNFIVKT